VCVCVCERVVSGRASCQCGEWCCCRLIGVGVVVCGVAVVVIGVAVVVWGVPFPRFLSFNFRIHSFIDIFANWKSNCWIGFAEEFESLSPVSFCIESSNILINCDNR